MPNKIRDLTGQTFGRLVAIGPNGRLNGKVLWLCVCECWNFTIVSSDKLSSGHTKSCGCLRQQAWTTHSHTSEGTRSLTYKSWRSLKNRCKNPRATDWLRYGGRGIKVCDRWLDFTNFLEDMKERPSVKHSINRINNDGNYEPGNCEWTTFNPSGQKPLKAAA